MISELLGVIRGLVCLGAVLYLLAFTFNFFIKLFKDEMDGKKKV